MSSPVYLLNLRPMCATRESDATQVTAYLLPRSGMVDAGRGESADATDEVSHNFMKPKAEVDGQCGHQSCTSIGKGAAAADLGCIFSPHGASEASR